MGRVIDLTKLHGVYSLGKDFSSFVLGDEIKEALEKLLEAIRQGESFYNNENNINSNRGYTANNLFIDGRRGSGKTTVLLTIKDLIENNFNAEISNDIECKKELESTIEELKKRSFKVVDSIIDTSVNTASITFYFLSWLKKEIEERFEADFHLNEQLYKTIKLFPNYLRSCEKTYSDIKTDEDIESRLDQSDLNFRKELFKLIDEFLKKFENCGNNSFIVLFTDDLDISFPPERMQKILTEVFTFLSHPRLIIVSAGNYKNLVDILKYYIRRESDLQSETSYKNIAKSFLEKTFAKYSIHIPELPYEYVSNLTIRFEVNGKKVESNFKEFLEQLLIVHLLSADSTLFKILFNGLSVRELVLILREVLVRGKKYNKYTKTENGLKIEVDTEKICDIPVIDLCFSDIYQRIKKLKLRLSSDTRELVTISSEDKPSEFDDIIYRIKDSFEQKIKNNKLNNGNKSEELSIFTDTDKQSILPLILNIEGKPKTISLFWVWFNENILFMNGFIRNIPKLLFIEIIREITSNEYKNLFKKPIEFQKSMEYLIQFLNFWKNLNYDLEEMVNYYSIYEFLLKNEKYLRFRIYPLKEESEYAKKIPQFLNEFIIDKARNRYLSYDVLFDKFSKLEIDIYELLYDNLPLENTIKFLDVEKILGNFRDKLVRRINPENSIYLKYALFVVFYINLYIRFFSNLGKLNLTKNVYLHNSLNEYEEKLQSVEIPEEIKKEIDWWIKKKFNKVQVVTIQDRRRKLERKFKRFRDKLKKSRFKNDIVKILDDAISKLDELKGIKTKEDFLKSNILMELLKLLRKIHEYNSNSEVESVSNINLKTISKDLFNSFRELLSDNLHPELKRWKEAIISRIGELNNNSIGQTKEKYTVKILKELFSFPLVRSVLFFEMPENAKQKLRKILSKQVLEAINNELEFLELGDENEANNS